MMLGIEKLWLQGFPTWNTQGVLSEYSLGVLAGNAFNTHDAMTFALPMLYAADL